MLRFSDSNLALVVGILLTVLSGCASRIDEPVGGETRGPTELIADSTVAPLDMSSYEGLPFEDEGVWPTVVVSADDISLGISEYGAGHGTACYYYGDGGIVVRLSDEYLSYFQKKGFTCRSLCMAVISGIRYNPETGERLNTAVFLDEKLLSEYSTHAPSDEVTLSPPECFRRGQPYRDCKFLYDPKTGKQLAPRDTSRCTRAGNRISEVLGASAKRIRQGRVSTNQRDIDETAASLPGVIYMRREVSENEGEWDNEQLEEELRDYWHLPEDGVCGYLTIYDISPEFPDGFGYALYAIGDAAGGLSLGALSFALNSTAPERQVDPAAVKALWAGEVVPSAQPSRARRRLPMCLWGPADPRVVAPPDRKLLARLDGEVIVDDLFQVGIQVCAAYSTPVRILRGEIDRSGKQWFQVESWSGRQWHGEGWTSPAMLCECVR